ncbi:MAG: ERAP1-like C-terminal domain-containing protein [Acidimicrobiales bacterium]
MDSWIFQGGFPLVSVSLSDDGRQATFRQERFGYEGGDPAEPQTWAIPLRFRWKPVGGDPITDRVLIESDAVTIDLSDEAEWIVGNAEGASFVRTAYRAEVTEELADLAQELMLPVERYALVDDAWATVLAGRLSASQFLSVLELMTTESDRSVWQRILSGFSAIDRLVDGDAGEIFAENVHDAIGPALAGLGLTPLPADTDRDKRLRADLIRAMGTLARDLEIRRRPSAPSRSGSAIPISSTPPSASPLRSSDRRQHRRRCSGRLRRLPQGHGRGHHSQEEVRYLYALADFPDAALLAERRSPTSAGKVRSQNVAFWVRRGLTNRGLGRDVWAFMSTHWQELLDLLPSNAVVRMVDGVTALTYPDDVAMVAEFFEANPVPTGGKTLSQILERQRVGAALRTRESARLQALLAP